MGLRRCVLAVLAAVSLAGCAEISSGPNASPEAVARAAYRHPGPPAITLYTMINNRTGNGAHSSMMINGSQRVVFDPAGSVSFKEAPEINDVLYGVTPKIQQFYESAHARSTYRVRIQRIVVSPEVAEQALQLAIRNGKVPPSQCTVATSGILSKLPGFEQLDSTWFPNKLAAGFAKLPGVVESELRETDGDDKEIAIATLENVKPGQ